ncbi:MAG: hypothetical protein UEM14_12015 [Faecalibacterium prausnitzii]|nr:hypothetical protein [Faecalibacterium prausnitzii]
MANKIERKYLAHFIDASFGTGSATPNYVRLGADLEEYNLDLNPDIEVSKNIIGDGTIKHNGYEPQSDVDTFYAVTGDPLFETLSDIANERKTGDDCKTTAVDVLLNDKGVVTWAYREDVMVVPTSMGGDTSGVQVPFSVYYCGNRTKGTFDVTKKTFTANTVSSVKA